MHGSIALMHTPYLLTELSLFSSSIYPLAIATRALTAPASINYRELQIGTLDKESGLTGATQLTHALIVQNCDSKCQTKALRNCEFRRWIVSTYKVH